MKLTKSDFKILVVDDVELEILLLESVLELEGFTFENKRNVSDAKDYLNNSDVDLIISDFNMDTNPDSLNGSDLLDHVYNSGYKGEFIFYTKRHRSELGDYSELSEKGVQVIFKNSSSKDFLCDALSHSFSSWLFKNTGAYQFYTNP